MKKAVVYDKWLHSMGGGEVVACSIAKILVEMGYAVTLVCGKKVTVRTIIDKLNIDLTGVLIEEIWNDEGRLKEIVSGSDLFINVTYMDYSWGFGSKNLYYTHFPTKSYDSFGEMLFSNFLLPYLSKRFKQVEFLTDMGEPEIRNKRPAYMIKKQTRIALSYLSVGKEFKLNFKIYFEDFYQSLLKNFKWSIENAEIMGKNITVNHYANEVDFLISVRPSNSTIYLSLNYSSPGSNDEVDKVFLLYPQVQLFDATRFFSYKLILERINNRLRAGVFVNTIQRIRSYDLVLSNSNYTSHWIKKYWRTPSKVLYPPVQMLFKKIKKEKMKKKNMICSVGRFFTLGHGKKQEVLIKAFKKLYDNGYRDWELHLAGGLGTESSSIRLSQELKQMISGYPVFFHFNVSRDIIEEIYTKSRIYWHAAGIYEDESRYPVRFEHFGISPIEAISAGCVPILFDGGGLREIVELAGFSEKNLFKTVNGLVNKTKFFIDEKRSVNWQAIYKNIDKNFSVETFKKRFLSLID